MIGCEVFMVCNLVELCVKEWQVRRISILESQRGRPRDGMCARGRWSPSWGVGMQLSWADELQLYQHYWRDLFYCLMIEVNLICRVQLSDAPWTRNKSLAAEHGCKGSRIKLCASLWIRWLCVMIWLAIITWLQSKWWILMTCCKVNEAGCWTHMWNSLWWTFCKCLVYVGGAGW